MKNMNLLAVTATVLLMSFAGLNAIAQDITIPESNISKGSLRELGNGYFAGSNHFVANCVVGTGESSEIITSSPIKPFSIKSVTIENNDNVVITFYTYSSIKKVVSLNGPYTPKRACVQNQVDMFLKSHILAGSLQVSIIYTVNNSADAQKLVQELREVNELKDMRTFRSSVSQIGGGLRVGGTLGLDVLNSIVFAGLKSTDKDSIALAYEIASSIDSQYPATRVEKLVYSAPVRSGLDFGTIVSFIVSPMSARN